MEKVFYHNMDCCVEERKTPSECFTVDFDFKEVIGDACDAVVSHLQGFKFKSKEGGAPPGHHINCGNPNCNYDDRSCECLPSPHCNMLAKDMRRGALVRVFFLLVACRNLAAEAAWEIFDMETMESVCFKNPDSHDRVLHCPAKKNPDAHLHLFELSLLFGGHCMKKRLLKIQLTRSVIVMLMVCRTLRPSSCSTTIKCLGLSLFLWRTTEPHATPPLKT
jgi:hypothetical protein